MPGDARSGGTRLRRSLAVIGIAAATVVALAVPAAADTPPGWTSPTLPSGEWVAFTVAPATPVATGRSTFAPVTLRRLGNVSGLLAAFSNWEPPPNPPGTAEPGWPLTFNAGTAQLKRADGVWCPYTASQCQYTVVQGGTFSAQAGIPLDGTGNPDPSQLPGVQTIALPAAKVLHVGFDTDLVHLNPTAGGVGQSGHITLDASSFTSDELAPSGALTYHWVVRDVADPTKTFESSIGPKVQLDINKDGTYCLQLTVTAVIDGFSASTAACAPGNPNGAATFLATNFAPQAPPADPAPAPAPAPAPPASGGAGGGFGGITFSNPQPPAPAVLSSAGLSSPAVVWLWRPDFYKPTPEAAPAAPITSNTPNLKGRHEIVVTRPGPNGASAGPWLAGMGAFGLAGGGWVLSRRRRLRLLELEP